MNKSFITVWTLQPKIQGRVYIVKLNNLCLYHALPTWNVHDMCVSHAAYEVTIKLHQYHIFQQNKFFR